MDQEPHLRCPLTGLLEQLGQIHSQEKAFHHGVYRELLLTNRQYAYSRQNEDSLVITVLNNDSQPATVSVPVFAEGSQALPLLGGPMEMKPLPIRDGRLTLTLPANWGMIYKII